MSNNNTGSLTDTLVAAHAYSFEYIAHVVDYPVVGGATGSGSVWLSFIPVPLIVLLIAAGLLWLVVRRNRKGT